MKLKDMKFSFPPKATKQIMAAKAATTPGAQYDSLDIDSEKGEHDRFLSQGNNDIEIPAPRRTRRHRCCSCAVTILPWISTIFFATLSLLLYIRLTEAPYGTYEYGFTSDFNLPSVIPLELVRFRGTPHFYDNGTTWRDPVDPTAPWPEDMTLFGTPSEEVDANWEELIGGRYFSLTEDEAAQAWGDKRQEYANEATEGYTAGLDVFHTLHCVNALRKVLRADYYEDEGIHDIGHTEHCLDIIRQTIQCYGSTTLIPTKYMEGLGHNYIDSDQVHTCRSFTHLREFTTQRRSYDEERFGDAFAPEEAEHHHRRH